MAAVDAFPAPAPSAAPDPWAGGHEQVVFARDDATGLRAIVAVYSTALGPALGGTRFLPYPGPWAALADVLDLARAMAYKNALAGLPHGGGKAVVLLDPAEPKPVALLHAYGRFIDGLGGRYVTAGDVGCTVADLDTIGEVTRWVTGRSPAHGGGGDSAVLTAVGIFAGMRAASEHRWGEATLRGRSVAVTGVGKVGRRLVGHLLDAGARVVVHDVDDAAVRRTLDAHEAEVRAGRLAAVRTGEDLLAGRPDVWSPCALGGAVTEELAGSLTTEVICGGANNQLAAPVVGEVLAERGLLYVPDFCVNAGGVIQIADEFVGYDATRARARAEAIGPTTATVLRMASDQGITPVAAAERLARRRIAEAANRPIPDETDVGVPISSG